MHVKIDGAVGSAFALVTLMLSTGCATVPESPTDRIQSRGQDAATVIDDPKRAAEAEAAFESMHDAALKLEESVAATRADLLAMHRAPSTTPEAFRASIDAMHDRNKPLLLELVDQRLRAAASTTEREWNQLQKD